MKIGIVGCGVAGSILGALLARRSDVQVVCYERAQPGEHAEAGTGLNVGPNAMKALANVAPDLEAAVRAASWRWSRWQVQRVDGAPVFDFPLSELADRPGIRIRWSELYRVLRAPLEGIARFGHAVQACGVEPGRPDRRYIESRTPHGTVEREGGIDLLVAGDGRYSVLRPQFAGAWTTRHVGVTIYRLLVPDTSGGLIDDYAWWFNGAKRLLAFRVPPGHVYIAGSFPIEPGADVPADQRTPEALRRHYWPDEGEPCAAVRWMAEQLAAHHEQIHWARLQETPLAFRDPSGQVLFLGDAAHGMVPTLGQGATQAVEDACVAAHLIGRALDAHDGRPFSAADVADLTRRIEAARAPRVQWVMDFSLQCTAAMLDGADGPAEMLRLREPAHRDAFRRLWSDVRLDAA
jgi:salicylate hydroxylase